MHSTCFLNPLWKQIEGHLLQGGSALVHAPKRYGKSFFSHYLHQQKQVTDLFKLVTISVTTDSDGNNDYASLWKQVCHQLSIQDKRKMKTVESFINALSSLVDGRRVLFILKSHGQNQHNSSLLLDGFQELMRRQSGKIISQASLLVLDDYSLYYLESELFSNISRWDFFERFCFRQFRNRIYLQDHIHCLGIQAANATHIVEAVFEQTGGHEGLILSVLSSYKKAQNLEGDGTQVIADLLLDSDQVDSLRKVIYKLPLSSLEKIVAYQNKKLSETYEDKLIIDLQVLGIILKVDTTYSVLCPGIISSMVSEVYETKKQLQSTEPVSGPLREAADTKPDSKLRKKRVFFSYAHGEEREKVVDQLYDFLSADEIFEPVRDRMDLHHGELLSSFMKRIGRGKCVIVAISEKYILSEYCMFELLELYRNALSDRNKLAKRIYPIRVEEMRLDDPKVIEKYLMHWREKRAAWKGIFRDYPDQLSSSENRWYDRIKRIDDNIGDLIGFLADVYARTGQEISAGDFEDVRTKLNKRPNFKNNVNASLPKK
jgi:hypothetical protein